MRAIILELLFSILESDQHKILKQWVIQLITLDKVINKIQDKIYNVIDRN